VALLKALNALVWSKSNPVILSTAGNGLATVRKDQLLHSPPGFPKAAIDINRCIVKMDIFIS